MLIFAVCKFSDASAACAEAASQPTEMPRACAADVMKCF